MIHTKRTWHKLLHAKYTCSVIAYIYIYVYTHTHKKANIYMYIYIDTYIRIFTINSAKEREGEREGESDARGECV